jgi:hypothetical protein
MEQQYSARQRFSTDQRCLGDRSGREVAVMELEPYDDEVAAHEAATRAWWSSIRLATAFSIVAGVFALLLSGRLPETTIIVSIIVVGTMVSWLHLEDAPRPATVRHPRRHHR